MAVNLTIRYDFPVRANCDALTLLPESGRMRDINGNSYERDELEQGRSESGRFSVSVADGDVDGWTGQEILDAVEEDAQMIATAFVLTEDESVAIDSFEVALPASDPVRTAYADANSDSNAVWVIDPENIVTSVSCELEPSAVVGADSEQ